MMPIVSPVIGEDLVEVFTPDSSSSLDTTCIRHESYVPENPN